MKFNCFLLNFYCIFFLLEFCRRYFLGYIYLMDDICFGFWICFDWKFFLVCCIMGYRFELGCGCVIDLMCVIFCFLR